MVLSRDIHVVQGQYSARGSEDAISYVGRVSEPA